MARKATAGKSRPGEPEAASSRTSFSEGSPRPRSSASSSESSSSSMSTWIGYCLPPLVSSVGQRANASLSIGVVAVLIGYVFKLQTDVATMATAIGKLSGTNPIQSGPSPVDEAVSSRIQELERAVQALSKAAANRRDPPAGALSVQDAVDRALWRFASDRTALIDYAMEAIGGRVLSSSGVHRGDGLGFIIQYLTWSGQDERQMLQPSMEVRPSVASTRCPALTLMRPVQLGRCWPMPGKTGWAIIRLGRRVFVDGITMEHISPDSTPHFEYVACCERSVPIRRRPMPLFAQDGAETVHPVCARARMQWNPDPVWGAAGRMGVHGAVDRRRRRPRPDVLVPGHDMPGRVCQRVHRRQLRQRRLHLRLPGTNPWQPVTVTI